MTNPTPQAQQQMPSGPRHPRDNRMAGDLASTGVAPARDAKPAPVAPTDGGSGKGAGPTQSPAPVMGPVAPAGTLPPSNIISGPLQLRPQDASAGLPDINDRYGKARRLDREPGFTPVEHGGSFK